MGTEDTALSGLLGQAKQRTADHPNGTLKKIGLGTAGSAATALLFWLASIFYSGGTYVYSLTYTIPDLVKRIEALEKQAAITEKRDVERHNELLRHLQAIEREQQKNSRFRSKEEDK